MSSESGQVEAEERKEQLDAARCALQEVQRWLIAELRAAGLNCRVVLASGMINFDEQAVVYAAAPDGHEEPCFVSFGSSGWRLRYYGPDGLVQHEAATLAEAVTKTPFRYYWKRPRT